MKTIKVYFENGDFLVTDINGTQEEITEYYVGKFFNLGRGEHDLITKCTKIEFI